MKAHLFLLLSLLFAPVFTPVLAQERPNVLVIIGDDQGWTDFSFMGSPVVTTPHLDQLTSESTFFPGCYVPSSLCRPSLASIATGLYPRDHGITGNDPPKGVAREALVERFRQNDTWMGMLSRVGYRTLQTGKWWEGHFSEGGFTDGMTTQGRHGGPGLTIGRQGLGEVEAFLADVGEDPWAIWYAPFLPHTPHNPPEEWLERYRGEGVSDAMARYRAMCSWFDATVGELLALVEEDTLVIFLTDNGWIVNQRNGSYAPRSKRSPYQGGVRTPMLVRWKEHFPREMCTTPVSSLDVMPTILEAVGLEVPEGLPGQDLLETARGAERSYVFGELYEHDVVDVHAPARGLVARYVVDGRWKLIRFEDPERKPELYDLNTDAFELNDLYQERLATSGRLLDALDLHWTPHEPERPNFLVVITDDQRFDQMGAYGHPILETPNMDRLAAEGVRFDQAFITTAICAASRATILTGRHERSHGYTFGRGAMPRRLARESYPAQLRAAGYRTGFCGKWGVKLEGHEELFEWMEMRGYPYMSEGPEGEPIHGTDDITDRALRFLGSCKPGEPFALTVSYNAPHADDGNPEQYIPPPDLADLYADVDVPPVPLGDWRGAPQFLYDGLNGIRYAWRFDDEEKRQRMTKGYWSMISGVDRGLGRLLDALDDQGLADDTIVIFTSDNGYFLGERGFAGKWIPHDESIHVPLVVRDPAVEAGVRDEMVLNLDLAPTILDLAGVPAPSGYQGLSLLPLLEGEADWSRRDFLHESRFAHETHPVSIGVRGERFLYVNYDRQGVEQLFDRWSDPLETKDLAGDPAYASVLERMRARCEELAEAAGARLD